jgi:ABC-type bacteriocin/lantibiotic exporter with double-glycine peptidase domain
MATIYVPWFALVLPFLVELFFAVTNVNQVTAREVKRLEAINRSFIFNNFNEVPNGLNTIKAYDSEDRFIKTNDLLIDRLNEVFFVVLVNQRWINFALSTVAGFAVMIVTLLAVTGVFTLTPAAAGLLTSYMINFSGLVSAVLNTYT